MAFEYKAENAINVAAAAHDAGRRVTANRYLKRIFFGNDTPFLPQLGRDLPSLPDQWCFQVVLDYGEHDVAAPRPAEDVEWPCRADPFSTYRAGFEVRTYRTCQRVLTFHQFPAELGTDPVLVRSTNFSYAADASAPAEPSPPVYSFLTSVTQTGWVADPGGTGYLTASLPALNLTYSALTIDDTCRTASPESIENLTGDFSGTGQRGLTSTARGCREC